MKSLKRFIGYYKPYKRAFFFDLLCAFFVSAIDLAVPMVLNFLLKEAFVMPDTDKMLSIVVKTSAIFLAMYIVRMAAQYYITSWGHIMGAKMESDMRRDLFLHYEKLSFSFYDKNHTGGMVSRIISDLFDISELAHHGPEDIVLSIFKITGSFVILMTINTQITLVLLAITLIMIIFSLFYNRKMRSVFNENRVKIADINGVVQDSLTGIRVVKAFAGEHLEEKKFEIGNNEFLRTKKNNYLIMGKYFSSNGFFQGLMYVAVILSGGFLIAKGTVSGADIITYILYINMFLEPVNRLVNFTEQFQKGWSGFARMLEVLDTDPDIEDSPGAVEASELKGDITFENVSFAYDSDELVLNSVNLTIPEGKTVALVGPSGSGKTTFCSLIPRFYEVTEGAVKIGGEDIRKYTQKSLRRNIGIVQQDVYLFNSSVRDNISYGKANCTEEELIDAAKKANIHEYITELPEGYDTMVGERGVRFSGGQKQRIAIARAFLKNPGILILDEATSALDNESERFIQSSLNELSKNRTTIVIAHRLSTIQNADKIAVLTENGIEEQGTHEELLAKNGIYASLSNPNK